MPVKVFIDSLNYAPRQILEITPRGQATMDGNNRYFLDAQFDFDIKDQNNIRDGFHRFTDLGAQYGVNIDKVLLMPVEYGRHGRPSMYLKRIPGAIPMPYDFARPNELCGTLCVPFSEGRPVMGIFANDFRGLGKFARFGAFYAMNWAMTDLDFISSFKMGLFDFIKLKSVIK